MKLDPFEYIGEPTDTAIGQSLCRLFVAPKGVGGVDLHARIELFGGPEDGREITLPIGADGAPLSPLPVPSAHRDESDSAEFAWYELQDHRGGVWIYKYTTVHTAHQRSSSS